MWVYEFTVQLYLSVIRGNDDPCPVESPEKLDKFLKFLRKNHTMISKFLWDNNEEAISLVRTERGEVDNDAMDCFLMAYKKEGLTTLYNTVKEGKLARDLTTVFASNSVTGAVGFNTQFDSLEVIVEMPRKILKEGEKHFASQLQKKAGKTVDSPLHVDGKVGLNIRVDEVDETASKTMSSSKLDQGENIPNPELPESQGSVKRKVEAIENQAASKVSKTETTFSEDITTRTKINGPPLANQQLVVPGAGIPLGIKKTFSLVIPQRILKKYGDEPGSIEIVCKPEIPATNNVKFTVSEHFPNIWNSYEVEVPFGDFEYNYRLSYKKSQIGKVVNMVTQISKSAYHQDTVLSECTLRKLNTDYVTHHDTFLYEKNEYKHDMEQTFEGFCSHVKNMSIMVTGDSLKDYLCQLENIRVSYTMNEVPNKAKFLQMLNDLFPTISKSPSWRASGAFVCASLGLFRFYTTDVVDSHLKPHVALFMMDSLRGVDKEVLLRSSIEKVADLLPYILKCALEGTASWEQYVLYVYPLLPIEEIFKGQKYFSKKSKSYEVHKPTLLHLCNLLPHNAEAEGILLGIFERISSVQLLIDVDLGLSEWGAHLTGQQQQHLMAGIHQAYTRVLQQNKKAPETPDEVLACQNEWKHVLERLPHITKEITCTIMELKPLSLMLYVGSFLLQRESLCSDFKDDFNKDLIRKAQDMFEDELKKMTSMVKILKFWKESGQNQMLLNNQYFPLSTSNRISRLAESRHWMCTPEEMHAFEKLCCDHGLFPIDRLSNLLSIIANSNYDDVFWMFLRILKQLTEGIPEGGDKPVLAWFRLYIADLKHSGGSIFEKLQKIYSQLFVLCDMDCLMSNADLLEALDKEARDAVASFRPGYLMEQIQPMEGLDKRTQDRFEKHLTSTITSIRSLQQPFRSTGTNYDSSLAVFPVLAALNCKKIREWNGLQDSGLPKMVEGILSDTEFWCIIFSAKGYYSYRIHDHPNTMKVKEILLAISSSIVDKTIPVHVADKLITVMKKNDFEDVIKLVKYLDSSSSFNKDIKSLAFTVDNVQLVLNQFLVFQDVFLPLLCNADAILDDRKEFCNALKNIKKQITENYMCKVINLTDGSNFWGPFKDMVKHVESLHPLKDSVVFLKMCKELLKESNLKAYKSDLSRSFKEKSQDEAEDGYDLVNLFERSGAGSGSSEPNVSEPTAAFAHGVAVSVVADFLATTCITSFGELVRPFFNGDDIPVMQVCSIFNTCKDVEREVVLIERYFSKQFNVYMKQALVNFNHFQDFRSLAENISIMLPNFELHMVNEDPLHLALNYVLKCTEQSDISLIQLSEGVECMKALGIDDNVEPVVSELARSKFLLGFLKENLDEDFRNLIDAVEEHSESLLREATVSQLIEVKRFLQPLIRKVLVDKPISLQKGEEFLKQVKKSCEEAPKDIAVKISGCNENIHALKTLYSSVANRGEMTKGIVTRIVQNGVYKFSLKSGQCKVIVSYTEKKKHTSYNLQELSDLRSRALLIINRDTNSTEDDAKAAKVKRALSEFIGIYDIIFRILQTSTDLHTSGHFNYRVYNKTMRNKKDLEDESKKLVNDLNEWESKLVETRRKFYFLYYVHSDQLWTLFDFFVEKKNPDKAHTILRFINPNYENRAIQKVDAPCDKDKLSFIGKQLHKIFVGIPDVNRPIKIVDDSDTMDMITLGEPFIVQLQKESPLVIATVLKMYGKASGCYPEPHQILFCSPNTLWDEINLLLLRCIHQEDIKCGRNLFCIANVELLPNYLQFELVDELKHILEDSLLYGHTDFLLSIICRGASSHPILDQFSQFTHKIQPMFDKDVETCLQAVCPETVTITSSVPGLGKTEAVTKRAHAQEKRRIHFPVSGPFDKSNIIERLRAANIKSSCLLHLDVAEVNDPYQLDIFIFELIALGMISSGTNRFVLPTPSICIEIANSLKHWLRNSLHVCTLFKHEHLLWQNYDDYFVSMEVTSSVQVVSHYMNALELASVDSSDLHFTGQQIVTPLPSQTCRKLLRKHFSIGDDMSFSIIEVFLNVLADQLKKLSASQFFRTDILRSILGEKPNEVKSKLVEEMIDVYKAFASRSVKSYREAQTDVVELLKSSSLIMTASAMVDRVDGMIRWADSNHLLVVFHSQDFNSVSAVYRECKRVPKQIVELFKTQIKRELPDYNTEKRPFLQNELEKIVRANQSPLEGLPNDYALTPDNLLKMVLIFLRIKAGIPVLIMGETGCGKTSLINYLAKTTECVLDVFSFHAGITEEAIIDKVGNINMLATTRPKEQFWIFLDEINTCDHLGLINEILCHKTMHGRPLSPNLVLLAACNPYRARGDHQILTTGLEGKVKTDACSRLVYRVHPLPEAMIDNMWDYGTLDANDERAYIASMVQACAHGNEPMLVQLLSASQDFIRRHEKTAWCVSLRDVKRCISLIIWFQSYYLKKKAESDGLTYKLTNKVKVQAIILSLAHCYNSRLSSTGARNEYQSEMAEILKTGGEPISDTAFKEFVRKEQEDLLNRMDLPDSTAKNTALRENVFVILVCILNRIPIFVVGKPGCSKSLSVQLIRGNLRGPDSRNRFFQHLPHLYVVSYQGSESSTSDGIIKVFDKAKRYKKDHSEEEDVLPVVLLDEIGLAEQSPLNPLKVLHSLLETAEGKLPDVAVVGISNWALDAAKMNRAIHLSRPEPDQAELYDTAVSISTYEPTTSAWSPSKSHHPDTEQRLTNKDLEAVSKAYHEYQKNQSHRNFHGLRDYYSLIKYLCEKAVSGDVDIEQWKRGLLRNFGGLSYETQGIVNKFLAFINPIEKCDSLIPVKDLVQENVNDKSARHLMLITHGDSALGILENFINLQNREHEIIFGSRFEEDCSEDYNYRILSRIILCMERGVILILKDLDNIYGSLYDMLNQNYTLVGSKKKKNCRIALGPYSNPMCHVHDDFRCVVLVDQNKVDFTDPPFLNRFEKQLLAFKDVLSDSQNSIIKKLDEWVTQVCTIPELVDTFDKPSAIAGYCSDMLPSLVLHVWPDSIGCNQIMEDGDEHECLEKCKSELMWIFTPDGMLRASRSEFAVENQHEIQAWQSFYFKQLPLHKGLKHFVEYAFVNGTRSDRWLKDEIGMKVIIQTRSNIMFDAEEAIGETMSCQVEKLSRFKSEKQLTSRINDFWFKSDKRLLVLQCKPSIDSQHMLLAKSVIDKSRAEFKQKNSSSVKHVLLIIHLDRDLCDGWQFNFLSGWGLVNLDSLAEPRLDIPSLLGKQIADILCNDMLFDIKQVIVENMLWAFSCIKYSGQPRSSKSVSQLMEMVQNTDMSDMLEGCILKWLRANCSDPNDHEEFSSASWQVKLASDSIALHNSSTVLVAFTMHLQKKLREPLAMTVFELEKCGAWSSYRNKKHLTFWKEVFTDRMLFSIEGLPLYFEVDSYKFDGVCLDLSFPYSTLFIERLSYVKDVFLDGYNKLMNDEDNLSEEGELLQTVYQSLQKCNAEIMFETVPKLLKYLEEHGCDEFMDDFCDIMTADHAHVLETEERIFAARWSINLHQETTDEACQMTVAQLLTNYWVRSGTVHNILRLMSVCKEVANTNVVDLVASTKASMNPSKQLPGAEESTCHADESTVETPDFGGGGDGPDICDVKTDTYSNTPVTDDEPILETSSEPKITVEDEDEIEVSLTPEDLLVAAACRVMLPTENVLNACDGVENWQHKVNLVLSVASRVSSAPSILYFLRVCNDFVMNLQIPFKLEECYLSVLAECALQEEDDPLESNVLFDNVMSLSNKIIDEKKAPLLEVQNFICLYLGRCYDSNQECMVLDLFFDRLIQQQVTDKELHFFGTIVDRLWSGECEDQPTLYQDLLAGNSQLSSNLSKLDEVLARCNDGHESVLAVMTCDILEISFLKELEGINKHNVNDDTSKEFHRTARQASDVIQENTMSLKLVVAVSFLKAYIRTLARLLKDGNYFISTDACDNILQEASLLMTSSESEGPRRESVKHFFFKVLHAEMSFQEMILFCNEYTCKLPAIQGIEWIESEHTNPIGYKVMSVVPDYSAAFSCYLQLLGGDDKPMTDYVKGAIDSTEKRLAILSVLTDNIFLVTAQRPMKDSEKDAAKLITSMMIQGFSKPFSDLVNRLCLETKFPVPLLVLSPETSVTNVHIASVVLHLMCMIVSSATVVDGDIQNNSSLLAKAFFNPLDIKELYVPASQDEVNVSEQEELLSFNCVCLHRIVTNSATCPVCSSDAGTPHASDEDGIEEDTQLPQKGYLRAIGKAGPPRNMTHASFNIFRMILDSCLVSGHALLSHNLAGIQSSGCAELSHDDFLAYCSKNLTKKWFVIQSLMDLPGHQLCCLMHKVLYKLQPLLTNTTYAFTAADHRLEWENIFTKEVEDIVRERHRFILEMKRQTLDVEQALSSFESHIDELQMYNTVDSFTRLATLFRFTPVKSATGLHGAYKLSNKLEKHPFLGLFFASGEKLSILKYLEPIIKWQKLITSCKSHHIARNDAQRTIKEHIRTDQTADNWKDSRTQDGDTKNLLKALEAFLTAWNEIRPFAKTVAEFDKTLHNLPILHRESTLQECVAFKEDSVIYKVISALAAMQNDFLEKVMIMATSGNCISLSFLLCGTSTAAIPIAPLHEALPSQIVQCSWGRLKEYLLKYSQFNTKYGMGYDLEFDFTTIEMELANALVLGKVHLFLDESFPLFSFARELQTNTGILKHAGKILRQERLSAGVKSQLREINERSPGNTSNLLLHLDVILRMLQRPHGRLQHPETPLVEYASKWYMATGKTFPSELLPQPANTIKLGQLVDLYDNLEELLCQNAEDKLPDKFREKLEGNEEELLPQLKTTKLNLCQVAKILRRFIFRYISTSEDRMPDVSLPLVTLLEMNSSPSDDSDGTEDIECLTSIFTPNVKISHVYFVVKLVERAIQETERKRAPSFVHNSGSKTLPIKRGKKQRRDYRFT